MFVAPHSMLCRPVFPDPLPFSRLPATTTIQSLGCFTDVDGDRAMEIDQSLACDEGEEAMSPAVSSNADRSNRFTAPSDGGCLSTSKAGSAVYAFHCESRTLYVIPIPRPKQGIEKVPTVNF